MSVLNMGSLVATLQDAWRHGVTISVRTGWYQHAEAG